MPVIRTLLLLVVLAGLALFAVQNLSTVLPITFLGMKTQALPLAVWIIIAIALGFFTSIFLQLLSYLQRRPLLARIRQLETEPLRPSAKKSESSETASRQKSYATPAQETPTTNEASDWEVPEPEADEDWDFDEEEAPETTSSKPAVDRDSTNYETRQEPKTSKQSGSAYSYSYREPKDSGVGRTEAVYDANYRVITPPHHQTRPQEEEEDWGFEDDEEEED